MPKNLFIVIALLTLFLGTANAYVTYVHAPAVLLNQDKGTLTTITLNITPGSGTVTVNNNAGVDFSTTDSAKAAARYASSYLGVNSANYNFNYTITTNSNNVSGPSAGLAFALLAISGITKKPLLHNFTETGTIQPNGTVGLIGGIYDKIGSANFSKQSFVLVPYAPNASLVYLLYYVSQQHWRIPVIEVKNVSQAVPYAFGQGAKLSMLPYNIPSAYNATAVGNSNLSCVGCNASYFAMLANYTFNLTRNEINMINGSRYGSVKSQMLSLLNQYATIEQKGYLYIGADLAFLEYQEAFIFANADRFNTANATTVLNSASSFCSSLAQPQLTDRNYEYVVGGQLRQSWANLTITNAATVLNSSETTDEIITALYDVAPAYVWCQGANEMYSIASLVGGTPAAFSSRIAQQAAADYSNQSLLSTNIYSSSLKYNYNIGDYGAVLYANSYANTFGRQGFITGYNLSSFTLVRSAIANASSRSYGVWSQQFAEEAQFFLAQANLNKNSSLKASYLQSALNSAQLSLLIALSNKQLSSNLTYNVSASTGPGSSYAALQAQMARLSSTLFATQQEVGILLILLTALLLLFIAFMVSLAHMLAGKEEKKKRRTRR